MQLSERLRCVTGMVQPCRCLCDIGTDHGYIPIELVTRGIAGKAIASDLRPGPCEVARKNIEIHGCLENITVRMGSGFETIEPGECDAAVIAGLGGNLMIDLFLQAPEIPEKMEQILLQPQNVPHRVRKFLYRTGYTILEEKLVYEEDKFYTVMSIKFTGKSYEKDPIYYYIGEQLLEKQDALLLPYLQKEIQRLQKILRKTSKEEYVWLITEYERMIGGLQNV